MEDWPEVIPRSHREFLHALKLWHQDTHGIYVHAGLLPGQRPEDAEEETLLEIREPFIDSAYQWEKVVVFGHTPLRAGAISPLAASPWEPLNRPEKIGIDTGAGSGGPLTAVILPPRVFISVGVEGEVRTSGALT